MKKTYLLTPGPTPIPDTVSSVFARQIIHHRTPAFETLFEEVRAGLKFIFQTTQEVLAIACTGTGVMDAAVSNLFKKGDTVITINGGKFGERWTKIAKTYGLNPIEIKLAWGDAIEPKQLEDVVRANPTARAILFQASETSTGVKMPVYEICAIAAKANMLSICDAITALGVMDLPMDTWGIDVLMTGSQKALMLPPGLAVIALSEKAWKATEKSDIPKFYFDLKKELKVVTRNQTAWTPAISLIQGLQESLRMIREEGLQNVFKRHEILALATREAAKAMGLEILASKSPSSAVTAVILPTVLTNKGEGKKVNKLMSEKYGVVIVGGQDDFEGKIVRLSHFGFCDRFDITTAIGAMELALNDLGYAVPYGKGVGAALSVFAKNPF